MCRTTLSLAIAISLLSATAGCAGSSTPGDRSTDAPATLNAPASPATPTVPADGSVPTDGSDSGAKAPTPVDVSVPSVLGLWPDDAAAQLQAAGLTVREVDVHGPVDPDAGDFGRVYRQTPGAGVSVPRGTVVEIRYWWESQ